MRFQNGMLSFRTQTEGLRTKFSSEVKKPNEVVRRSQSLFSRDDNRYRRMTAELLLYVRYFLVERSFVISCAEPAVLERSSVLSFRTERRFVIQNGAQRSEETSGAVRRSQSLS